MYICMDQTNMDHLEWSIQMTTRNFADIDIHVVRDMEGGYLKQQFSSRRVAVFAQFY